MATSNSPNRNPTNDSTRATTNAPARWAHGRRAMDVAYRAGRDSGFRGGRADASTAGSRSWGKKCAEKLAR